MRKTVRTLQRWLAVVTMHPATAGVAVRSRAARQLVSLRTLHAGAVLAPNPRMAAEDQLQVYNGGYLARLVEVMQSDFGAVQHALGEGPFRALVAAYVTRHPSRHPNLNRLGRRFPAFVRSRVGLPHRAFVADLAELELAMCRAFDAPEFTPLDAAAFGAVPAERWPKVGLRVNPSVQLLRTRFPVDVFYQAWKDGKPRPVPAPERSWTLVFRRQDRVWRQRLPRGAHAVLGALAAGAPFGAAVARARGDGRVGSWFQGFASDGLFTALGLGRGR